MFSVMKKIFLGSVDSIFSVKISIAFSISISSTLSPVFILGFLILSGE